MATRTGRPSLERNFHGQHAGAGLLQDVHAAFLRRHDAELRQKKPGADDGMAGQRQLAFGGKNAQASEGPVAGGLLHEYSFGKIHLARDGLHLPRGETVAIGDHGDGIAREGLVGENVELIKVPLHLPSQRPITKTAPRR